MPKFTTSDGLSLHYEDEGSGLPILCLAGLTRTTRDFDYVTPHLAGNRLIKMDYRGRGQSDFAKDWSTYTLPIECRDVLELLDHLGLDAVSILGTSRGGLNAMGLALGHPDRILGAAFNDVGPELDARGLDAIMGITYDPKLRDAVEAGRGGEMPDLWPFFDALAGKPIACIRGANSDLLSAETLSEMQKRRPDMHVAVVPDRAHIPFLDKPEAVAALTAWVKELQ